ncbi:Zinc metalloprotease ZmpB [Merluccius polli]|uniref:Zinc metalloprotease ZmpB n=1 Tax=Merluccius polli TaxID=89951 RepID=A0AA47M5L5_MERPO|nr:Zinc metalloprotease ZmpB [Merluccius polli]
MFTFQLDSLSCLGFFPILMIGKEYRGRIVAELKYSLDFKLPEDLEDKLKKSYETILRVYCGRANREAPSTSLGQEEETPQAPSTSSGQEEEVPQAPFPSGQDEEVPQAPSTFRQEEEVPQAPFPSGQDDEVPQAPSTSSGQEEEVPQAPFPSGQDEEVPQAPSTFRQEKEVPQAPFPSGQDEEVPQAPSTSSGQEEEVPQAPFPSRQDEEVPQAPSTFRQEEEVPQAPFPSGQDEAECEDKGKRGIFPYSRIIKKRGRKVSQLIIVCEGFVVSFYNYDIIITILIITFTQNLT